MIFIRKINENGLFLGDDFVEELNEFTIETPIPNGLLTVPKWDGEKWVESGMAWKDSEFHTEPIITADILKQQIDDTDYKIIKCYEYSLAGLDLPYDITELHTERQALRDKINELEEINDGETI